jgi:glycosyltransferase involved in cell wall biosynthesis
MTRPHSVALISAGYPPYMSGGIDVQTYDLAHALSSVGVNVTVFCGGARVPALIHEHENLEIFRLPMADIPPRVVWFQLQNLEILKRTLPNYDIIHTQHSSGSIYGFLKKKTGKPWVVSFHDHQLRRLTVFFDVKPWNLSLGDIAYYTLGCPIFEFLTRMELKWADYYIACGESGFWDYVNFSKMDPAKTTVIPNGIDLEKIRSALRSAKECENSEEKNDFVIFTCGRLYASKGIQYLLRAMPYVLKRFKNVRLKIFGKGPMHSYLQNLVSSLNLKNKVTLEGHVSYDHLIYEMSKSDLAVFPSMVEVGASLAVMEAMVCHKAVVAFKYPFSTEVIKHLKTGYLVSPKNVNELAKAICDLIDDETLRKKLGENAYHNVVRNHDTKNVVKKYLEVYSNVLSMQN